MNILKVLEPGFFSTVQDLGRYGFQRFGVPVSGAADYFSHYLANLLVGNDISAAALELTMVGPRLKVLKDVTVGFTGPCLKPVINGKERPGWSSYLLKSGEEVRFNVTGKGCRSYLAVPGGIDVPLVMNSRSTYAPAMVGGHNGRPLQKGDIISARDNLSAISEMKVDEEIIPVHYVSERQKVRVLLGPQDDYFTCQSIDTFLSSVYTVTHKLSRMGCRLEGHAVKHRGAADIISDGVPAGGVQIPGHGQPIVMLWDRQSIGGYPKIATVSSPDLDIFAQLLPGKKIEFKEITEREAAELSMHFYQRLGIIRPR